MEDRAYPKIRRQRYNIIIKFVCDRSKYSWALIM